MNRQKILMRVELVFIVLGIVTAATAFILKSNAENKHKEAVAKRTESVMGTVTDCEKTGHNTNKRGYGHTHNSSYRDDYIITVDYEVGGRKYVLEYGSASQYPVGSVTPVTYDPSDPTSAHIGFNAQFDNRVYIYVGMGGAAAAVLALVLLLKGMGILPQGRRRY